MRWLKTITFIEQTVGQYGVQRLKGILVSEEEKLSFYNTLLIKH